MLYYSPSSETAQHKHSLYCKPPHVTMIFKSNDVPIASASSNVNVNGRQRIRNQGGMANGNNVKMNGTTSNPANPPRPTIESEEDRKVEAAKRRGSTSQTQGGNNGQARHRASRAGTRCVSKLSAAQLARKRANDREAQRAIRQRTKDHIENLERRIEELSDPSKELKIVWEMQQRNRELEEELRVLKQRMASMQMQNAALTNNSGLGMTMGMGQDTTQNMNNMQWPMDISFNDTNGMGGFGTQTLGVPKQERPGPTPGMTTSFSSSDGLLSPYASESPTGPSFPELDTGGIDFGGPMPATDDLGLGSDLTTQRSWTTQSPFDIKDTSMFSPPDSYIPPNNMSYTFTAPPAASQTAPAGASSNVPYNIAAAPPSQPQQQKQQPLRPRAQSQVQRQQQQQAQQQQPQGGVPIQPAPTLPAWAQTPRFLPPASMIDSILQDALHTHRTAVLSGSPNPSTPDYTTLLSLPSSSPSPLSAAINRAIQLAGFKTIAVQAAVLYTTHALLRWQTNPLPDTYAHVPVWLRPGPRQLEVPHALWVAQLVWPRLRDRVVGEQQRYARDELAFCYARCLTIEWKGEAGVGMGPGFDDGIFEIKQGGEIGLTQRFEATVRELGAWGLEREFTTRWPEMGDVVRTEKE